MKYLLYLFTCLTVTFVSIYPADKEAEEKKTDQDPVLLNGLNSLININGFETKLNYQGDVFSNLYGGAARGKTYLDNINLSFNFNLEELFGWNGATFYSDILGIHGDDPAELTGALQGTSSIAAFQTWKLYQCWLEQNFLDNNLSVLVGLYDLNSEFDSRLSSSLFINPSHGMGAEYALTGENGPSAFPNTSLAVRLKYNISPSFNFKIGIYDGVPGNPEQPHGTHILLKKEDGILLSSEISFKSESEELNSYYFKCSVGGWLYTGNFEKSYSPEEYQEGNSGIYLSAEKFLFAEDNSSEGLSAFIRLGTADKNLNQVDAYYGAGIHYLGLIPGRENDVAGIALASIHNNSRYISAMASQDIVVKEYEHIIEFTYLINISGWLSLQPDLQYIINPVNGSSNSLVIGTRCVVSL